MFRHCSKLPLGIVTKSGIRRHYYVRFYKTSSYYQQSDRKTSDKQDCPPEGSGRGFYYTLGAVVLGTGAVVAYAKHDQEFRSWLADNVPGSDGFIAFISAEETSHLDYLVRIFKKIKHSIWGEIMKLLEREPPSDGQSVVSTQKKVPCTEEGKPYVPPPSPFKPLASPEEIAAAAAAAAQSAIEAEKQEKSKPEDKFASVEATDPLTPLTLVQLENEIVACAEDAIKSYTEAVCILRDYAEEIYTLVEESVEKVDPKIWNKIKEKGEKREASIKSAEESAKKAVQRINILKAWIDEPNLPGGDDARQKAKQNLDKILLDIEDAKDVFAKERERCSVTDRYWSKVQEARKHFSEELEILFPSVRLSEKNLKLTEGEIDLFILYAFQNILFYQKELTKLDTIRAQSLKQALEDLKKNEDADLTEACVEQEVEKVKRKYGLEFQKRMLMLRAECEKNMRLQMKRQADAHADILNEAMEMKEKEIERKMRREMEERFIEEKNKFKQEIASIVGRLRGMDDAMKKRASQDKRAQQSQILWSACQALEAALRAPAKCDRSVQDQMRPLQSEVNAILRSAAPGDELVDVIMKSLPPEVTTRGVFNDIALRERFLNVERVAKRVAMLPEGGASLPLMLLSYLQSLFIITPANPIPAYELANEPIEPDKFNTFDILQRARYFLDRGDLYQTLKYMNLLKGAPKVVASDWIRELRIYLETLLAARALMAHASAAGLAYSA